LNENVFLKFIEEMIFYYANNPFLSKIISSGTFKKRIFAKYKRERISFLRILPRKNSSDER